MTTFHQLHPRDTFWRIFFSKIRHFHQNMHLKISFTKYQRFCLGLIVLSWGNRGEHFSPGTKLRVFFGLRCLFSQLDHWKCNIECTECDIRTYNIHLKWNLHIRSVKQLTNLTKEFNCLNMQPVFFCLFVLFGFSKYFCRIKPDSDRTAV